MRKLFVLAIIVLFSAKMAESEDDSSSLPVDGQTPDCENCISKKQQRIINRLEELERRLNNVGPSPQGSQDHCRNTSVVCDCSNIRANGYLSSGVYRIYVDHRNVRYYADVFCDMAKENGGWTVFQRRKDGSEDFYREWDDYSNGFGDANGEYWLGNRLLYLLTSKRKYRLRIDMGDFEGESRFAKYKTFSVGSSADKYRLTVGGYSGNAGDSLRRHNDRQFTTKDQDNDKLSAGNCAVFRRGAWWYDACDDSNLNGLYIHGNYTKTRDCFHCGWEGIEWNNWHGGWYSMKTTEMKISSSAN